jgi:hypothetical protein
MQTGGPAVTTWQYIPTSAPALHVSGTAPQSISCDTVRFKNPAQHSPMVTRTVASAVLPDLSTTVYLQRSNAVVGHLH